MKQPFSVAHRVEFRDTDAAGIMHFSTFITYMEESEHAFLRSLGLSVMDCEVEGKHLSWPRVSVSCDYQRPLRFEEEFEVQVSIAKLGNKSITYHFVFVRNEEPYANGKISAVCCELIDGKLKSHEIPESLRQQLNKFVEG